MGMGEWGRSLLLFLKYPLRLTLPKLQTLCFERYSFQKENPMNFLAPTGTMDYGTLEQNHLVSQ